MLHVGTKPKSVVSTSLPNAGDVIAARTSDTTPGTGMPSESSSPLPCSGVVGCRPDGTDTSMTYGVAGCRLCTKLENRYRPCASVVTSASGAPVGAPVALTANRRTACCAMPGSLAFCWPSPLSRHKKSPIVKRGTKPKSIVRLT